MTQTNPLSRKSLATSKEAPQDTIVIHHLSDLLFRQEFEGPHPLFTYGRYVTTTMPIEKRRHRPDIVIITGNITLTGTKDDLNGALNAIRGIFTRFAGDLKRHVFIVPGTRDIDWANHPPSYTTFFNIFKDFGLPTYAGAPFPDFGLEKCLVYPINTCLESHMLPRDFLKKLNAVSVEYENQQKEYERDRRNHKKGAPNQALRERYLQLVNELMLTLDSGIVRQADVTMLKQRIGAWSQLRDRALTQTDTIPPVEANPLKILVTHHPLIPHPGKYTLDSVTETHTADLLLAAQELRFDLALHGYTSIADVQTAMHGGDNLLRHVGGGRLGSDKVFNEIIARRSPTTNRWLLEITTIPFALRDPNATTFFLMNPANDSADALAKETKEGVQLTVRREFGARMRLAMRQLSEDLADTQNQEIPFRPLTTLRDAITNIIFRGFIIRVGLAIKTEEDNEVVLRYRYMEPDSGNEQQFVHPFHYPLTAAAWALILGRHLIFPANFGAGQKLTSGDYRWIEYNDQHVVIRNLLEEYVHQADIALGRRANASTSPESDRLHQVKDRAQMLLENFNNGELTFQEMYQKPDDDEDKSLFKAFIAMPVPLRPDDDSVPQYQQEIGTLIIDVRRDDSKKDTEKPQEEEDFFTPERVDMLKSVADLLYVVLATADILKRPKGSWHVKLGANPTAQ